MNSLGTLRKPLALILLSAVPSLVGAEIYKCTGVDGALTYQAVPCAPEASESKVHITEAPDPPAPEPPAQVAAESNPSELREQAPTETPAENRRADLSAQRCRQARAAYQAEAEGIVASCKQARNTYCNKSAEEIELLNDMHWLRGASDQEIRNYNRVNADGTKLERLKRDVDRSC